MAFSADTAVAGVAVVVAVAGNLIGRMESRSSRLAAVETKVDLILSNHLPHIQATLDKLLEEKRNAE